ncbi:MAG: thioredoxin fold domain-containing protein [Alphaproteobacteria bacterium]|nr:MAG: thioredoxin fold domain-containing protein [Alphaproteobacteria bacterium]
MTALLSGWRFCLCASLMVVPVTSMAAPAEGTPIQAPGMPGLSAQAPVAQQTEAQPSVRPDPSRYLPFQTIMKFGGKVYYMGRRYGLDGWFIVQEGKIQIAYTTADGMGIMFGMLMSSDGANITSQQLAQLSASEEDVRKLMQGNNPQSGSTPPASPAFNPPMATPPSTASSSVQAPASGNWIESASRAPVMPQESLLTPPDNKQLSPGEQLLSEFATKAQGVSIGKPGSPEVVMVMDPQCSHCKQTWRDLYDDVAAGRLRLRLVPTGNDNAEHDKLAAGLLASPKPGEAWNKHTKGDSSGLEGMASPDMIAAIHANHELIVRWGITRTPYLIYRGRDNQVKIVEGKPKSVSTLIADLPPAAP